MLFSALLAAGAGGETPDVSSLLETAKSKFRQGKFDDALTLLEQVDKAKSGNAESLDLRGAIYLEQGKIGEAKKAFQAASQSDAALFPPRLHLADALLREKQYTEARNAYDDLLEKTNVRVFNERLRYAILLTYLFEHNETRARSALERITFPTESPAYYCAQAAWEFAHDRKSEATKWLKAASRMFDTQATAWFARPLYDFGWAKEKPSPSFP